MMVWTVITLLILILVGMILALRFFYNFNQVSQDQPLSDSISFQANILLKRFEKIDSVSMAINNNIKSLPSKEDRFRIHKHKLVSELREEVDVLNGVVDDEIYKDEIILELREKKTKEVEIFLDFLSEVTKGTSADNNIVIEKFKMWREVCEETTSALKQFVHKLSFHKSSGIMSRIAIGYSAWSSS